MCICPWCDEVVDELAGDDKVETEDGTYHYECFVESNEVKKGE